MAIVLAILTSITIVVSTAQAGAANVHARKDSASVVAGQTVAVNVLANDKVVKRGAKVRITGSSSGMTVEVVKQKVRITTSQDVFPADYRIRYRVSDRLDHSDNAKILLTVKPVEFTTTPAPTTPTPTPTPTPPSETNTLSGLIASLPVAAEVRTGYDRATWKHWNSGTAGVSYCDTRDEVLISESIVTATWTGASCTISGQWYSYYDGVTTTDPSTFDIDHMVALAEAHDSGGYAWSAATKEEYANDQANPGSLVAVTASSNRGKGDRDPGEWLPLLERCRYIGEWVAVKHRWDLSVDQVEKDALTLQASNCENVTITVIER
ncbi:MAG: HNH endonuclease family protein [Nocardioides sp.]|uniref:HNH endonuclease family protein n=1 Tax=Nocardioides sp. TaxID=35761 RepID=UPI00326435D8